MKISLYSITILFMIYSLLILPDPVHLVHILLFFGGSTFFVRQLYKEIMAKRSA